MFHITESLKDSDNTMLKQVVSTISEKYMANTDYFDFLYMNKVIKAINNLPT